MSVFCPSTCLARWKMGGLVLFQLVTVTIQLGANQALSRVTVISSWYGSYQPPASHLNKRLVCAVMLLCVFSTWLTYESVLEDNNKVVGNFVNFPKSL